MGEAFSFPMAGYETGRPPRSDWLHLSYFDALSFPPLREGLFLFFFSLLIRQDSSSSTCAFNSLRGCFHPPAIFLCRTSLYREPVHFFPGFTAPPLPLLVVGRIPSSFLARLLPPIASALCKRFPPHRARTLIFLSTVLLLSFFFDERPFPARMELSSLSQGSSDSYRYPLQSPGFVSIRRQRRVLA